MSKNKIHSTVLLMSAALLLTIVAPIAAGSMIAMPIEIPALTADLIGVVEITEVSEATNEKIQLPHLSKPRKCWHKIYTATITKKDLYANRNKALEKAPEKDKPITFKFIASTYNPKGPRICIPMPEFKVGDKVCVMLVKSKNLKHLYLPTYYQNYRRNDKDAKAFKKAAEIKIHWSKANKEGIQIGVALKTNKLTVGLNDNVTVSAFVLIKNTSDKVVGICNYPSDNCFSANYIADDKKTYPINVKHRNAGTDFNQYFITLLQPGQARVFSTKAFPGAIKGTFKATKGEKVKVQFTFKNSRKAKRDKINAWVGELTTPAVEVEIK